MAGARRGAQRVHAHESSAASTRRPSPLRCRKRPCSDSVVSLGSKIQAHFKVRWPHRPSVRQAEGRFRTLEAAKRIRAGPERVRAARVFDGAWRVPSGHAGRSTAADRACMAQSHVAADRRHERGRSRPRERRSSCVNADTSTGRFAVRAGDAGGGAGRHEPAPNSATGSWPTCIGIRPTERSSWPPF